MVSFIKQAGPRRWLKYLLLSMIVNLQIVSFFSIKKFLLSPEKKPPLKMTLISFSSPLSNRLKSSINALPLPIAIAAKKDMKKPKVHKRVSAKKEASVQKPIVTQQKLNEKKKDLEKLVIAKSILSKMKDDHNKQESNVLHKGNNRKQVSPIYPLRALKLGQEGTVTLQVEVAKSGLPQKLKIVQSSGYPLLDAAAFSAVKKWEFEAKNVNGQPIVSFFQIYPKRLSLHEKIFIEDEWKIFSKI